MIDTKELRRKLGSDDIVDHVDIHANVKPILTELLARLEAAEKERDVLRTAVRHEADCVEAAMAEIKSLRAKIEAMEQQEPARLVTPTAYRWRYRGAVKWQYGELTEEVARLAKEHNHEVQALGILPGAQTQPAPSIPEGWKLVPIAPTETMISAGSCASSLPGPHYISEGCAQQCWEYMLAAAPEAKL